VSRETVGQVFDRHGPCALMAKVATLAELEGRIPVGHWVRPLEAGWTLTVNGTAEKVDGVPPWHGMMESTHHGWPVVLLFDAVSGDFIGPPDTEDRALAVLDRAIAEKRGPAPC